MAGEQSPKDVDPPPLAKEANWQYADDAPDGKRGKTKVVVTERVLRADHRRRIEHVQACLTARRGSKRFHLRHEYQLRT